MTSKRITKADLLCAGWHALYYPPQTRYAHPNILGSKLFKDAARILKERGIDENGDMR